MNTKQEKQMAELMDMYGPEPLHPELAEKLTIPKEGDEIPFSVIRHYLYHSIMHHEGLNKIANKTFEQKKRAVAEMFENDEVHNAIDFMVEKPYRMDFIVTWQNSIRADKYWELVRGVWSQVENLWQYTDSHIRKVFKGQTKSNNPELFHEEDLKTWNAMPEKISIYRGCQTVNRWGWSWTTSLKTARWFATRYGPPDPAVITVHGFPRDKAVFFAHAGGRSENEVVVDPAVLARLRPKLNWEVQTKGIKQRNR